MNSAIEVRLAQVHDMGPICSIVNHFIRETWFNFRTVEQTPNQVQHAWEQYRQRYPWLVAVRAGVVLGVAYAGPWKQREAYDWCAEVTVYTAFGAHRRGIAGRLYEPLIRLLSAQGFRTLVAVIALPNDPSVALHGRFAFRHAGTLRAAGYKHGSWHDVGFWQRLLATDHDAPDPILDVATVLHQVLPGGGAFADGGRQG